VMQRERQRHLALHHDRVIYLLKDSPANRKLIHRYIDVFEYPDGRIELRADGVNLVYERYDRLPQVDTATIVENKRLSHALQTALVIQAQRDDRRKSSTPSRTNEGQAPYSTKALPGTKRSRQFTPQDLDEAVRAVCRAPGKQPCWPPADRPMQAQRPGSHGVRRAHPKRRDATFPFSWHYDI
jgi:hypothetical protein